VTTTPAAYGASDFIVVADGQSLNVWGSWLIKARTQIEAAGYLCSQRTTAISGWSWDDLARDVAARTHPFAKRARYPLLALNGGQSNIWRGDTGATVYNAMVAYAAAARAAGFTRVVAFTMPPNTSNNAAKNTERLDANSRILADASSAFDAKVDLTTDPGLNDTGSASYFDGVHWTEDGGQRCANLAAPVILPQLTQQLT
jgi:hypothetical protein